MGFFNSIFRSPLIFFNGSFFERKTTGSELVIARGNQNSTNSDSNVYLQPCDTQVFPHHLYLILRYSSILALQPCTFSVVTAGVVWHSISSKRPDPEARVVVAALCEGRSGEGRGGVCGLLCVGVVNSVVQNAFLSSPGGFSSSYRMGTSTGIISEHPLFGSSC